MPTCWVQPKRVSQKRRAAEAELDSARLKVAKAEAYLLKCKAAEEAAAAYAAMCWDMCWDAASVLVRVDESWDAHQRRMAIFSTLPMTYDEGDDDDVGEPMSLAELRAELEADLERLAELERLAKFKAKKSNGASEATTRATSSGVLPPPAARPLLEKSGDPLALYAAERNLPSATARATPKKTKKEAAAFPPRKQKPSKGWEQSSPPPRHPRFAKPRIQADVIEGILKSMGSHATPGGVGPACGPLDPDI